MHFISSSYLKASNTDYDDQFGSSVALDGDTLVVGASREDSSARGVNGNQSDNSSPSAGAAYVFYLSASPKILAINQIGGEVVIRYHGILQKSAGLHNWSDLDPQLPRLQGVRTEGAHDHFLQKASSVKS